MPGLVEPGGTSHKDFGPVDLSNRRSNDHVRQLSEVTKATTAPKSIQRAPEQTLAIWRSLATSAQLIFDNQLVY